MNSDQAKPGRLVPALPAIKSADMGLYEDELALGDDTRQFITFKVEDEEYGIDILWVREIMAWTDVTRLPNAPEHVRGLLNLRGVILPVFDLRCQFGLGAATPGETHVIVIVAVDSRLVGILVDGVSEILNIDASEIKQVPDMQFMVGSEYMAGLAIKEERMVALLNVEELFDYEEMLMLTERISAGAAKSKALELEQ